MVDGLFCIHFLEKKISDHNENYYERDERIKETLIRNILIFNLK